MNRLRHIREERGFSQRELAKRAGLSFRGVQLLERDGHDMRCSSLRKVSKAVGLPESGIDRLIDGFLSESGDSLFSASLRIMEDGSESWPLHLFDFVDSFRKSAEVRLVSTPPVCGVSERMKGLMASTVETLCAEHAMPAPDWCLGVAALKEPWFVSGIQSLKAMALVQSPIHFRKRNIFVLGNFLKRT